MMNITKAEFVVSNTDVQNCPAPDIHEYAFIGRSNVGKSSLINMLVNCKTLAKTASTPGKTQLINHFRVNDSWYIVDLPGYGYARTSKGQRNSFETLISNYVLERSNLVCLFVLVDSRIPPQQIDLDFINWLGENGIPFVVVFTKIDKVPVSKRLKAIEIFHAELSKTWQKMPLILLTSSEKKLGREEMLSYIEELNKEPLQIRNSRKK